MAIIYVSNAATNGYVVGSDANNGSTKALAKLTYDGAMAVAVAGDTIKFNSGTFTKAGVFNHNAAVHLDCEGYRGTTLQSTSAGSRGFLCNHPDGTTVNIGALVFDDSALSSVGFELNPGAAIKYLNVTGAEFKGGTSYAFQTSGIVGLTLTGVKATSSTAVTAGVGCTIMGASGYVKIEGIEFALTGSNNGLYVQGTPATPINTLVRFPYGSVNRNGVGVTALSFNGVNVVVEGDITKSLTIPATSGSGSALITVRSLTGFAGAAPIIRRIRGGNLATGGYAIRIGSDGNVAGEDNLIPGGIVTECELRGGGGAQHGIMFGSMNDGVACYNKLFGFGISLLSKLQTRGAAFFCNDISDGTNNTDGYTEAKGTLSTQGPLFCWNNIRMRAGYENKAFLAQANSAQPNAGASWIANNVHVQAGATVSSLFTVSNDSSVCNFIGWNNYNVLGTLGGNPFQYQATFYTSVNNWATKEPTVRQVSPVAADVRFWKYSYLPLRMMALRNNPALGQIL